MSAPPRDGLKATPHALDGQEVAKALLRDIILRCGLPLSTGSDNEPAFVSEINLCPNFIQALGIKWKLDTAYRPQSSGNVERMNQTLKTTLAKLCQETQLSWVDMLTLALLLAWYTPRPSGYTPFEILYGRTSPVIERLKGNPQPKADREMSQHLQALGKVFYHMAQETLERTPIPLGNWVHPYQPGDEVWVKDWKKEPLQPVWTDPHMVVLETPTAVKVVGIIPWIHHTRVKKAAAICDEDTWQTVRDPENPLKVWFQKQ